MQAYWIRSEVVKDIMKGMPVKGTFCKGFFNGFDVSFNESI